MDNVEGAVWKFLAVWGVNLFFSWYDLNLIGCTTCKYNNNFIKAMVSHMAHFSVPGNWYDILRISSHVYLEKWSRGFRRSHCLQWWSISMFANLAKWDRPPHFMKLSIVFHLRARPTVQKRQRQKYICLQSCKLGNVWIPAIKINSVKTIEKSTFPCSVCLAHGSFLGFRSAAAIGC